MTQDIRLVDVSEIEKLAKYAVSDAGLFPSNRGDLVRIADLRALLSRSPQQSGEAVAVLALNNTELKKRIATLEDLLSSACNIANREGADTHWQRYAGQLHINGISPVTAKTFKILPSDTDYKPSSQARIEQLEELLGAHDLSTKLIDAWIAQHGKQISWGKAIEIVAVINKMDDNERSRLLTMDEPNIQIELEMLRGSNKQLEETNKKLLDAFIEVDKIIFAGLWSPSARLKAAARVVQAAIAEAEEKRDAKNYTNSS